MTAVLRFLRAMVPGLIGAAVLFAALFPLRQKRLRRQRLVSGPLREALMALFWLFCGGMAVLTLTPPALDFSWKNFATLSGPLFSMGSVNLIPFRTFTQSGLILLGNVIMFLPFGLLAALLWRNFSWKRTLLTALCITAFIECAQLFVGRAFDIDDLMLNALGVLCGRLLWAVFRRLSPAVSGRFWVKPK